MTAALTGTRPAPATPASPEPVRRRRRRSSRTGLWVTVLLGPSVLLIALLTVAPAVYGIYLSFTNTQLTGFAARDPKFVGIDNFVYLLSSPGFLGSLGRTAQFVLFSAIIGQTVLGMVAALLLSRTWVKGKGVFGAAVLLPMIVPEVVASLAWASVLSPRPEGTLNRGLDLVGAGPVAWLQADPMTCVIVVNIWRGIAFAMIMFQAALEDVPDELIEAARIDGASAVQVFWNVTLPLIRGPVFLYLLLTTISTTGVFGLVFFLTQGGPGEQTQLASIYIFQRAFQYSQIGLGSAASVIILVLVLVLGLTYVRLAKVEV